MPYYDLPKGELIAYAPELSWPNDAELFWSTTLAASRAVAQSPVWHRVVLGSPWSTHMT